MVHYEISWTKQWEREFMENIYLRDDNTFYTTKRSS